MVKDNVVMVGNDPSANVQQLVGNAVKYLENLQKASEKNFDEKLKNYIENARRESISEANRINALRAGDIEAVKVANDRAIKQAELLATQMLENAEVLRKSVETTATAIATQLQQITTQQDTRFSALEKTNYENKGKEGASPDLVSMVASLIDSRSEAKGKSNFLTPIIGALYVIGGSVVTFLILQFIR